MVTISFPTAGDIKKDNALKNLINRKVFQLTELTEEDPVTSTLIALDVAIELLRNNKILQKQKRIIEQENWRIKREKFFKDHRG